MKRIFFILFFIILSCKKGVHKNFSVANKSEDLAEIEEYMTSEEFALLTEYINTIKPKDHSYYERQTYSIILKEAQDVKLDEQEFERTGDTIVSKTESRASKQRKLAKNIELLCATKWKMKEVALQVELPDTTQVSLDMGKLIMERVFSRFVDASPRYELANEKERIFYRAFLNGDVKEAFSFYDEKERQYFKDSTFVESYGTTKIEGKWRFKTYIKLHEFRPNLNNQAKSYEGAIMELFELNENSFVYSEKNLNFNLMEDNLPSSFYFVMHPSNGKDL